MFDYENKLNFSMTKRQNKKLLLKPTVPQIANIIME